jgi:hypothetical protein
VFCETRLQMTSDPLEGSMSISVRTGVGRGLPSLAHPEEITCLPLEVFDAGIEFDSGTRGHATPRAV